MEEEGKFLNEEQRKKKESEWDHEFQKIYLQKEFEDQYCIGGVLLIAMNGQLTCKSTMDTRISMAHEQCIPEIREKLFGDVLKELNKKELNKKE